MSTSASRDVETIGRAWVDAFNRRDADGLIALSSSDIEWHPTLLVGSRRVYRGHDGLRRWIADLQDAVIQHSLALRSVHRLDGRFALVADIYIEGDLQGNGALVGRLGADGTIVEGRAYLTDAALLRQLGVIEG